MARPGEFSERAFLNDKCDLVQAEAIADLIASTSEQAARSSIRSLQGLFSSKIETLIDHLVQLRVYVEAAIDFPDEEIDLLSDSSVMRRLDEVITSVSSACKEAHEGQVLQEGMTAVIAGRPNAGKSSLLNALSGRDSAIVTDVAGTTRDLLCEHIHIDGMPLHIVDTAGLRDTTDVVEKMGVERALDQIQRADRVLMVTDSCLTAVTGPDRLCSEFAVPASLADRITVIRNKIDISGEPAGFSTVQGQPVIGLSALSGQGFDALRQHLKECMGYAGADSGTFSARRRHVTALQEAANVLKAAKEQMLSVGAGELLAEDLRMAQRALEVITGRFTSDDLLGEIFSSFCIGK